MKLEDIKEGMKVKVKYIPTDDKGVERVQKECEGGVFAVKRILGGRVGCVDCMWWLEPEWLEPVEEDYTLTRDDDGSFEITKKTQSTTGTAPIINWGSACYNTFRSAEDIHVGLYEKEGNNMIDVPIRKGSPIEDLTQYMADTGKYYIESVDCSAPPGGMVKFRIEGGMFETPKKQKERNNMIDEEKQFVDEHMRKEEDVARMNFWDSKIGSRVLFEMNSGVAPYEAVLLEVSPSFENVLLEYNEFNDDRGIYDHMKEWWVSSKITEFLPQHEET